MKTATLSELKKNLSGLPPAQLNLLLLRLARFKKENKELLTYLLFEADDEAGYIEGVCNEVDALFAAIRKESPDYLMKKSVRKVLRMVHKSIRFSGEPTTEISLLLHFCKSLKRSIVRYDRNPILRNMYSTQIRKIEKALSGLHEDIQGDFRESVSEL